MLGSKKDRGGDGVYRGQTSLKQELEKKLLGSFRLREWKKTALVELLGMTEIMKYDA